MAYNKKQFRSLIERILKENDLYSPAAVNLLLGTAAIESQFGTYLKQITGPALSAFQIEPATFRYLKEKYADKVPAWATEKYLEWDLRLAIIVARLKYLSIKYPLPTADDIKALAHYWKQYYNTPAGKGTEAEFVKAYKQYVS